MLNVFRQQITVFQRLSFSYCFESDVDLPSDCVAQDSNQKESNHKDKQDYHGIDVSFKKKRQQYGV